MTLGPRFESVLVAARAGSDDAWADIYRDLVGPVTGYLRARVGDDAEDVASEVFLSVAQSIHGFSGDESHFRSWVFVIAHRRISDHVRARKVRIWDVMTPDGTPPEVVGGNAEDEAVDRLSAESMTALVALLPATQRDVVLLRIVAGLSIEQTAQVLGKKTSAIKVAQHRGLTALRNLLEE